MASSKEKETLQNAAGQLRLIKHFKAHSPDDQTAGWSNLWDTDSSNLWDRGMPSPALIDLIEERSNPLTEDGKRQKALVPGCGKGYDVVMLALHGFEVYGLEVSETGASVAREYARTELRNPQNYNFGSHFKENPEVGKGEVTILQGDFFKRDWEGGMQFDLIYDYTFLCALHPNMRRQWAGRMADLLAPGGQLVCLEFPLFKDPKMLGPPWGLKGVHWDLLAEGGDGLVSGDVGEDVKGEQKGAFERLLYLKPERSYANGKGTDMLSVWSKKST
ncbi:S-adenosyl-L-methionine-dependent methyltransferase [Aspergillus novoparasiticus]|uniref:S-adenosyl-L-methionine-dependent methyltransferase n=1 Tax=Aspergillus novoparasiticus TaxID=986946 RepID=A0A5N6F5J2_9EURO|nr:S-adenosyl-L-methionine-dependent methyltransferase [Aspergillus novoparasiticus]